MILTLNPVTPNSTTKIENHPMFDHNKYERQRVKKNMKAVAAKVKNSIVSTGDIGHSKHVSSK
jgi:hypothetical protein